MGEVFSDLLTGTATPEVIRFAGWMLLALILLSCCSGVTYLWAPRWCHLIMEYAIVIAWVAWGLVCVWFYWQFTSHQEALGLTPNQIDFRFGGSVLGYFGLAILGAIFAVAWEFYSYRDRQDATS